MYKKLLLLSLIICGLAQHFALASDHPSKQTRQEAINNITNDTGYISTIKWNELYSQLPHNAHNKVYNLIQQKSAAIKNPANRFKPVDLKDVLPSMNLILWRHLFQIRLQNHRERQEETRDQKLIQEMYIAAAATLGIRYLGWHIGVYPLSPTHPCATAITTLNNFFKIV